jgi:hypothetical protein
MKTALPSSATSGRALLARDGPGRVPHGGTEGHRHHNRQAFVDPLASRGVPAEGPPPLIRSSRVPEVSWERMHNDSSSTPRLLLFHQFCRKFEKLPDLGSN